MANDFIKFSLGNKARKKRSQSLPRDSSLFTIPKESCTSAARAETANSRKYSSPNNGNRLISEQCFEASTVIIKEKQEKIGLGIKFFGGEKLGSNVYQLFALDIAKNSPASRALLPWGPIVQDDEILEINGVPVNKMTRSLIIQEMISRESRLIEIRVRRKHARTLQERAVDCPAEFKNFCLTQPVYLKKKKRRFFNLPSLLRSKRQDFDITNTHFQQVDFENMKLKPKETKLSLSENSTHKSQENTLRNISWSENVLNKGLSAKQEENLQEAQQQIYHQSVFCPSTLKQQNTSYKESSDYAEKHKSSEDIWLQNRNTFFDIKYSKRFCQSDSIQLSVKYPTGETKIKPNFERKEVIKIQRLNSFEIRNNPPKLNKLEKTSVYSQIASENNARKTKTSNTSVLFDWNDVTKIDNKTRNELDKDFDENFTFIDEVDDIKCAIEVDPPEDNIEVNKRTSENFRKDSPLRSNTQSSMKATSSDNLTENSIFREEQVFRYFNHNPCFNETDSDLDETFLPTKAYEENEQPQLNASSYKESKNDDWLLTKMLGDQTATDHVNDRNITSLKRTESTPTGIKNEAISFKSFSSNRDQVVKNTRDENEETSSIMSYIDGYSEEQNVPDKTGNSSVFDKHFRICQAHSSFFNWTSLGEAQDLEPLDHVTLLDACETSTTDSLSIATVNVIKTHQDTEFINSTVQQDKSINGAWTKEDLTLSKFDQSISEKNIWADPKTKSRKKSVSFQNQLHEADSNTSEMPSLNLDVIDLSNISLDFDEKRLANNSNMANIYTNHPALLKEGSCGLMGYQIESSEDCSRKTGADGTTVKEANSINCRRTRFSYLCLSNLSENQNILQKLDTREKTECRNPSSIKTKNSSEYKKNFASLLRMSNEDLKKLPLDKRKEQIQSIREQFLRANKKRLCISTPNLLKQSYTSLETEEPVKGKLEKKKSNTRNKLENLTVRHKSEDTNPKLRRLLDEPNEIGRDRSTAQHRQILHKRSVSDMSLPNSRRRVKSESPRRRTTSKVRDMALASAIIPIHPLTIADIRNTKGLAQERKPINVKLAIDNKARLENEPEQIEEPSSKHPTILKDHQNSAILGTKNFPSDTIMDSSAFLIEDSKSNLSDSGKSRPPPDGHEFPVEYQDTENGFTTNTIKKFTPVPRPRSSLPPRDANGKPPLWNKKEEKNETNVRAKIALFSSDDQTRLSPINLSRSGDSHLQISAPNHIDLSKSFDSLNTAEHVKPVLLSPGSFKARRPLQEKSQSLLDVNNATLPRRSPPNEANRNKFSQLLEYRQRSMTKLKGLVIPNIDSLPQSSSPKLNLPEIISKDSILAQESGGIRHELAPLRSPPNNDLPHRSNIFKSQLSELSLNGFGVGERDMETDSDSAVSSSRSSLSSAPSPPLMNYSGSLKEKEVPRVLKADSIEALNRRNVLESARFRKGAKGDDMPPSHNFQLQEPPIPQKNEVEIKVAYVTDCDSADKSCQNLHHETSKRPSKDGLVPPIPSKRNSLAKFTKDYNKSVITSFDEVDRKGSADGYYRITRTSSFSRVEDNRIYFSEISRAKTGRVERASSFSKKENKAEILSPSNSNQSLNIRKASLESLSTSNTYTQNKILRPIGSLKHFQTPFNLETKRQSSFNEISSSNRKSSSGSVSPTATKIEERRASFGRESVDSSLKTGRKVENSLKSSENVQKTSYFHNNNVSEPSTQYGIQGGGTSTQFKMKDAPSPTSIRALTQRFEAITTDKLSKTGKPQDNKLTSVSDIKRAFEKAEKSLNHDDDTSGYFPGKSPSGSLRRHQQPHGIFMTNANIYSANLRMSSMDSSTSEDNSLSNSNHGSGRDQFGSITSLASTTSLISPQELQQLIEDANQSLEESGTSCHEIVVVVLHRGDISNGASSMSLGITLAGGSDHEMKQITVHKIIGGSVADRDGRIQRGDRVLSINGRNLKGVTHREALQILKAPRPEVVLVLSRNRSSSPQDSASDDSLTKNLCISPRFFSERPPKILETQTEIKVGKDDGRLKERIRGEPIQTKIYKDGAGLGFSLEGGKDSPTGDKPLTIKKIFTGGAADKCGIIQVGDQIVAVNGIDTRNMSRLEAWNFMKKLPDGEVQLTVAQLQLKPACDNL